MTSFSPSSIDLSRILAPDAIDPLSYSVLLAGFVERFKAFWATARAVDPALPNFDVELLETDPAMIVGQAWSYLRLLDRARVNDGIRALLGPLSTGTNLDNLVAARNLVRLVTIPATDDAEAVYERDDQLFRRYLLSFDAPASGSAGRYLFDAFTAYPNLLDARINGHLVHGRRGDTDVVIIGQSGDLVDDANKTLVSDAVRHVNRAPEGVSIAILNATRHEYSADLKIVVPGIGPDPELLKSEAVARVRAAGDVRTLIGGEIPNGFIVGAAYGDNVIEVIDRSPVIIGSNPYAVPVLTSIVVDYEVRS